FSAMRHRFVTRAPGVCFILPARGKNQPYGEIPGMEARHIATVFPARMTGSPAEMRAADYSRQQFADMGYESDSRAFRSRYIYT
ncbi:aminopeptidase, partial [Enterobacter hormaechei]|nr:aminopeptidase [Enterobacter hormaechei]